MSTSSDVPISVQCRNVREAQVAIDAILAFRGGGAPPLTPNVTGDAEGARAERIETALRASPVNGPKEIVLQLLLAAAPKRWVKFSEMQTAFEAQGTQPERASAAIRDLSSLMGRLPPEDIAGLKRHIEVLAERTRAEGEYRYRLTRAGRLAVGRVLATDSIDR